MKDLAPSPGGGPYDAEVQALALELEAAGVFLVVTGGPKGGGYSIACRSLETLLDLPRVLRRTADAIEKHNALTYPLRHPGGTPS